MKVCKCGKWAEAGSEFCRVCLGLEDGWMHELLPRWAVEALKKAEPKSEKGDEAAG